MKNFIFAITLISITVFMSGTSAKERLFEIKGNNILLNYSFKIKKKKFILKKMKSGISQRILYSIGLFQAGSSNPVSAIVRFCSITYDLWDEKYSVICESPGKKLKTTLKKDKQLLYFISSFSRFKIGLKNFIKSDKEYYVKTTVQLNPVSPKLLRKVRAWLRQSDQSSYTTNYLGSFLSLFVSKNIGGNDLEFNFKTPAMKGILIK